MKKYLVFTTAFVMSSALFANPASTEYVNQQIREANAVLTNTFQQAVNTLSTTIEGLRISPHFIGEKYQGGIVFFVDDTGLHGLIAALKEANNGIGVQWQNGESGEKVTNARALGIGAGNTNTNLIISQQTIDYQGGNFAALAAKNFSVQADGKTPCTTQAGASICYGDWYLPSIYELDLMRINLPHFVSQMYWSSTESSVNEAWAEDMSTGTQQINDKAYSEALVRAIRAF